MKFQQTSKSILATVLILGTVVFVNGCGKSVEVARVDSGKEIALTDKWNDEDSRLVAEEMINDMLSYPWISQFNQRFPGKEPLVTVQRVRNKSHEHIAVDTFVNDIKRAVIRSGKAGFIATLEERQDTRAELADQDMNASADTRMEMGEEDGANFALSGTINSIVDQLDNQRVTYYQVDLKLINLQTAREVWNGSKKIKKFMERKSFSF
ncbi:MAG: penicillin-binding protein activator LpoB [Deltaproteobacteria bacterium]|uniref:Penicillin-binding protein activator LpoB n=1 Tax=SAR324 cluster bacterium TaxID=2024889 RepID=A0A2D6YF99_9DELT|nr:penicillin-binding protein activator LpoB [Deltaproteobacteria bacterium]MAH61862.1 penicillin-binding protein activator LpoB [SAR324 cluster bacterium]HCV87064.1 penicillin-binding protein activator LpoB [Deltaproteobacteria bacterium]|tara:strand:- start:110 stop:736 length:627 start_codon:yes stop_codon:yes gene_type:complete